MHELSMVYSPLDALKIARNNPAKHVVFHGLGFETTAPSTAMTILQRMKRERYGGDACVIGEVRAEPGGIVSMRTGFGGTRIVDMLVGEQLPRIC